MYFFGLDERSVRPNLRISFIVIISSAFCIDGRQTFFVFDCWSSNTDISIALIMHFIKKYTGFIENRLKFLGTSSHLGRVADAVEHYVRI